MSGAIPTAPRSASQPRVQFDLGSEIGSPTSASSPDQGRHRRREQRQAGYETDDSDSTLDGNMRSGSGQTTPTSPSHSRRRHKHHHQHSRDNPEPLSATSTASTSSAPPDDQPRKLRRHRHRHSEPSTPGIQEQPPPSQLRRHEGPPPESPASDSTIDLPERFDKHGRKKPETGDDPLADKIDELLSGKGPGGKFFGRLTGLFGDKDGDEGGSGGRRRR